MSDELKNLKFEKGLEDVEKIVQDLESGELALEDALKRYEKGVQLSQVLQKRLGEAGKKIEVLTRTMSGGVEEKPFELENDRKKKRPSKSSDNDLLI